MKDYISGQGNSLASEQNICGTLRHIKSNKCVGIDEINTSGATFWPLIVDSQYCRATEPSNVFCYNTKSRWITKIRANGEEMFAYTTETADKDDNLQVRMSGKESSKWRFKEIGSIQSALGNCWQPSDIGQIKLINNVDKICEDKSVSFDFQTQNIGIDGNIETKTSC